MTHENLSQPKPKRPYEVFGLTEKERLFWRVEGERFDEILKDESTLIHDIKPSSNSFGEFLFVTASRPGDQGRICMTFYGYGFHEYRERWVTNEWFWYQATAYPDLLREKISKEDADEMIQRHRDEIWPDVRLDTQTDRGFLFETLADLTDDDGAMAEIEDIDNVGSGWFRPRHLETDGNPPTEEEPIIPPTGENLLDDESREKLPPLYNGEEKGLDALAQVRFFTPDAQWVWYASEYDQDDIFFGLVSGLDVELGYFSLSELQSVKGPLGLPIERDLHFEPKTLRELKDMHRREMYGEH